MTDVNKLITDNIDVWTSAIKKRNSQGRGSSKKIELTGVKKLRELILELAVRGKLVPQDANDEPARVLLERIAEEKLQLVADKKIKKQKPLPTITDEEIPFVLPSGWEWLRLGNAGSGSTGKTPSTRNADFFGGNIQFIGPGNITPKGQLLEADKYLTELGVEQSTSAIAGDLLMVCIGGSIGKSAIAIEHVAFNQQINAMQPIEVLSKFLKHTVSTHTFYNSVIEKSTGSATPIINRGKWEELLIPIAPLAEQHRIVAKVDELMALCDQLDQQTEESLSAHQTLVEVLLAALTNSENVDDFQTSWQRIAEHFDVLFTTENSIEQLKQTILQLAVMGKLVPQNPSDEPASVLLEKIAEEKAQLIADKKIKKQKPLPPITDEEKTLELPSGWEWVKWDNIAIKIGDVDHKMPTEEPNGVPYVSPRDFFPNNVINFDNAKKILHSDFDRLAAKIQPQKGDIIFPRYGTIGANMLVETDIDFLASYSCCVIKTMHGFISAKYQFIFSLSFFVKGQCKKAEKKTTQPNVGIKSIQEFVVPLPPLAEQHRIEAKVDELMALCEQLKARLSDAQTTQLHLADAVVENALN